MTPSAAIFGSGAIASGRLRLAADLDADGHDDFVIADEDGLQAVWIYHEGGYRPAFTVDPEVMVIREAADVDGDGRLDLIGLAAGKLVVRLAGQR